MIHSADLEQIARHANEAGLIWAVGASFLLQQHGLVDNVHDLDVLVAAEDAERSHLVLQRLGQGQRGAAKAPYQTIHFYEYLIGQTDLDVISRFRIEHAAGVYELLFDSRSITSEVDVRGIKVPCMALEDWFVLYLLMAREQKARLIEAHLKQNGVTRPDLLKRALEQELPPHIRARVQNL